MSNATAVNVPNLLFESTQKSCRLQSIFGTDPRTRAFIENLLVLAALFITPQRHITGSGPVGDFNVSQKPKTCSKAEHSTSCMILVLVPYSG